MEPRIVCFQLALKLAQGATLTLPSVLYFFFHMIVPSVIIGFAIGFLCTAIISLCSEMHSTADAMIQVVVTICCGYLAFFIAESELASSGVIATVCAGLTMAYSCWPLFVSKETVHIVWEAIEFIGNTVIFFLAGLIFMNHVLSAKVGLSDFMWLGWLYLAVFLIRLFMIAFLWIPLNLVGQPIHWQEGAAMVWSGLRGAVSLAMAMIVDIEHGIDDGTSSKMMFHIGGIAALTLLVNSVTTKPLLKTLGLIRNQNIQNHTGAKISQHISDNIRSNFETHVRTMDDVRFAGANPTVVRAMVPALRPQATAFVASNLEDFHPDTNSFHLNARVNLEWRLTQVYREVFLRVVQRRYWQSIELGVIPRQIAVCQVLLHSVEEALNNTGDSLKDFDIICQNFNFNRETGLQKLLSKIIGFWPLRAIPQFQRGSAEFRSMIKAFIILSYIEAHTFAQHELPLCLGKDCGLEGKVYSQVIHESNLQKQKADDIAGILPPDSLELAKSEMLARRLLRQNLHELDEKEEAGFLTYAETDELRKPCHKALRDIAESSPSQWRDRCADLEYLESKEVPRNSMIGPPLVDSLHYNTVVLHEPDPVTHTSNVATSRRSHGSLPGC